ncbi:HAAS signaling domain-containing protein [Methanocella conradii]|uniref:HAAS signaling domain-containing protein n=1 Tax=Methanocella conradii TaxID=1175444 RepID=UPI0024B3986C|nr:hypothetical protein [Methanocella conradii]MDI6896316.1 hypothetical protein [Methanocella conradii]
MIDTIIDDYIRDVTKDMDASQRGEVAKELRTHILDSAEAMAAEGKVAVDEAIIRQVIDKMGPAEKIAAMYPSRETLFKNHMWKAVQALVGIAVAFLIVAALLSLVAPGQVDAPVRTIIMVVSALALAIVVISAIFMAIYFYESRLKATYEERLRRLNKSLSDMTSPLKVALSIAMVIFWLAIINLFWQQIPFLMGLEEGRMISLLTPDFTGFLPYINLLGACTIVAELLFVFLRQKWVPAIIESALNVGSALLIAWVYLAFPFSPEFTPLITAMIKVALLLCILGFLMDAAQKLWKAAQFFIHGSPEKSKAV